MRSSACAIRASDAWARCSTASIRAEELAALNDEPGSYGMDVDGPGILLVLV